MSFSIRRPVLAVVFACAAAVGGLVTASPAQAQPVASGTWTFDSDPGDWVGGGQKYAYATGTDTLRVTAWENYEEIDLSVDAANGDWWSITLAAPRDHAITVGSYPGATRAAFREPNEPGIDHGGNGRGCNTITGSFVVTNVLFGPHGYVEKFDASYEQHCEGGEPAARGRVQIHNEPAPEQLTLSVTPASDGTFSRLNGAATIHGTVACSADVPVRINGDVTQVKRKTIIRGTFTASVDCEKNAEIPWSATATPTGTTPFQLGRAEVNTTATATDPAYGTTVTDKAVTTVTLTRA